MRSIVILLYLKMSEEKASVSMLAFLWYGWYYCVRKVGDTMYDDNNGFFIMFAIVFVIVISIFIIEIISSIVRWNKNNQSPRLSVKAKIVGKRTEVSGGARNSSAFTRYYITFQVESGDRMELLVDASEYGMMAEGDQGTLQFQGTRFLSFDRDY